MLQYCTTFKNTLCHVTMQLYGNCHTSYQQDKKTFCSLLLRLSVGTTNLKHRGWKNAMTINLNKGHSVDGFNPI